MDEMPTTKRAILERTDAAAAALDRAIDKLTDEQLLAAPPGGGWSPRDILAHMAADLRWFAEQLEAKLADRLPTDDAAFTSPPPPPGMDVDLSTQDGRNAAQYELNRHLSLTEVRERWITYRERVMDAIQRLPDASFDVPHTIAPLDFVGHVRPAAQGDGDPVAPLWRWIAGNTWHHFEDHLKDFESAAGRG